VPAIRYSVRARRDLIDIWLEVSEVNPAALRASGKPAKVALVAAMRKLLLILNAMLKTKTVWRPSWPDA
jgi:hypothetical protein